MKQINDIVLVIVIRCSEVILTDVKTGQGLSSIVKLPRGADVGNYQNISRLCEISVI